MKNNQKPLIEKSRKLVIVGDGMCGKTCLLCAFAYDKFDPNHTPTIFETYASSVQVDNKMVTLALFDIAGQEEYDGLRPLSYSDTNVVLICFNINCEISAKNVTEKWNPEIRHFCPSCPVILVGCKKDLRIDSNITENSAGTNKKSLSTADGKRLAERIQADCYMECSAKTREGVQDLFVHAARLSLQKRHRVDKHRCRLL